MNIWFGRRLRILAWHGIRALSRSHRQRERACIAQQTKATAQQHITRQEQHENDKALKHFSAAQHAESRRYLLPGEDRTDDRPQTAKTPEPESPPETYYGKQGIQGNFTQINGKWVPMGAKVPMEEKVSMEEKKATIRNWWI